VKSPPARGVGFGESVHQRPHRVGLDVLQRFGRARIVRNRSRSSR
jgi:hypothetical protein